MSEYEVTSINPQSAWPVLKKEWGFSDQDMAQCLTMSAKKVRDVADGKSEHGGRGAAQT